MTLELILFCSIFGLIIMASYTLGLRNGQKLSKKEEITMPDVNPVSIVNKQIEKHEIKHEIKKEQELLNIMMDNIDNYDGTGTGQKELPN